MIRFRLSLAVLVLASGCRSHPTSPSAPTNTNPPAAPVATAPEPGVPDNVAASSGFEFLGSDPAPGGEASATDSGGGSFILRDLTVRLAVHFNQSLPDARVALVLLAANGRPCADAFVSQPVAPGHVYPVSVAIWAWDGNNCGNLPVSTVTLKATLWALRGSVLTDYVTQTFPVGYTIRRYPPPPPNPPQPPPAILQFYWTAAFDPVGTDPPIPGEVIRFPCIGAEADGAPITVRLTQRWEGLAPVVHTKAFEAGASSSPSGALFEWFAEAPARPRGTIECAVTNDRGQHVVQTVSIPLQR